MTDETIKQETNRNGAETASSTSDNGVLADDTVNGFDSEDLDAITETPATEEPEKGSAADARKEAEDYKEQLLRTLAEFENYKKRTQREIHQILNNANEKLIIELLPVIDDLERSLKAAAAVNTDEGAVRQVVQGFEMIYTKFLQILQRRGLRAMESVGQELNVDYHDALMQAEKADTPPNIILEEFEKGYFLNDKVIRHAKVIVSK